MKWSILLRIKRTIRPKMSKSFWFLQLCYCYCCWFFPPKTFESRMSNTRRVYRQHTKVFIIFDPFCLIKLENVDVVVSVAVAAAVATTISVLFYLVVVCHLRTDSHLISDIRVSIWIHFKIHMYFICQTIKETK